LGLRVASRRIKHLPAARFKRALALTSAFCCVGVEALEFGGWGWGVGGWGLGFGVCAFGVLNRNVCFLVVSVRQKAG